MKEYRKFLDNANHLFISKVIIKVMAFLMIPIYTRYLTTGEYGNIDIITTTANLLIPIFTLGISEAVLRYTLDNKKAAFFVGLKVNLISYIAVIFFSIVLNKYVVNYKYMNLLVLYYISAALLELICMYIQGLNQIKRLVRLSIIGLIVSILITIFYIFTNNLNITNYFITIIISNLIPSFLYFINIGKENIDYIKKNKSLEKEMILYSSPFIFNSITWWVNNSFDKYVITYLKGIEDNGIYSIAIKIPSIFTFISNAVTQAMQISIIQAFDTKKLKRLFENFYNTYQLIGTFFTSTIILLSIPITKIMFGIEFYDTWKYIGILIIASFWGGLLGILGTIFAAAKKTQNYVMTTIIGAIINVILNVLFVPFFGIMGAVITTAISYFVILIIRMIQVKKITDVKFRLTKDLIIYLILIIQTIISLIFQNTIGYLSQILIVIILIFMYYKDIKITSNIFIKYVRGKFRRV